MIENKEFLIKIYEKLTDNVKQLEDVRFKLLAIVPSVSAIGIKELYGVKTEGNVKVFFAILGIVITSAIFIYELRNRQILKALNHRKVTMERQLGDLPESFLKEIDSKGIIKHGVAMNLIYISSIVSWAAFLIITLLLRS